MWGTWDSHLAGAEARPGPDFESARNLALTLSENRAIVETAVEPNRFVARLHRDLDCIAHLWNAFESGGASTAFQKRSWVNAVIEQLSDPPHTTPLVVEVVDRLDNHPLMLLPLVKVQRRTHSTIEGIDFSVSDYIAPLLAPGVSFTPEESRWIWESIKGVLPPTDLIHLRRIPSQIFNAANPLALLPSCQRMEIQAFGVDLKGDPETLVQRLCRKSTFRDFAKFRRRLERLGKVSLKLPRSRFEVDSIFEALLAQRRHRFREIGRSDLLASDHAAAFYRMVARQGYENGPVRIFGLFVDDECVATAYGITHAGAFHLLIQTMDTSDRWRTCSPGLQVTADVMKWALQQGMRYFDFTIGLLPYKLDFGAAPTPLFELSEARSTRGHIAMRLKRVAATKRIYPAVSAGLRHTARIPEDDPPVTGHVPINSPG
jgi:CelD/BcsL family acetyltransferase involved in cellulose biosynthesis